MELPSILGRMRAYDEVPRFKILVQNALVIQNVNNPSGILTHALPDLRRGTRTKIGQEKSIDIL